MQVAPRNRRSVYDWKHTSKFGNPRQVFLKSNSISGRRWLGHHFYPEVSSFWQLLSIHKLFTFEIRRRRQRWQMSIKSIFPEKIKNHANKRGVGWNGKMLKNWKSIKVCFKWNAIHRRERVKARLRGRRGSLAESRRIIDFGHFQKWREITRQTPTAI